MKTIVAGLFLAISAYAQLSLTVTSPSTTVRPGQNVTVNIGLAGAPSAGQTMPAALQWTLPPPSGWTSTIAAGAASTAATKSVQCSATTFICLAYGMNQNLYATGFVGVYTYSVPASAPAGPVSLALGSPIAASAVGSYLTIGTGSPLSLTVLAITDINGDGVTNVSDVQIIVSQSLGDAACTADQNGDSKCDITDVQKVVAAVGI